MNCNAGVKRGGALDINREGATVMKLNTHLSFSGDCEAAFRFYEDCLGGKIVTMLRYGDSPMAQQVPQEWRGKVVHATILVGDGVLMGADAPEKQYERPRGFFVVLGIGDPVEAERIFHALEENGTVQMPIQRTFWALRFGIVVDRFGIPWEINCEKAADL